MSDYKYQEPAAEKIIQDLLKGCEAAVLAAAPGSGKTTISHIVINKYLEIFPEAKILVLTHGQNLLKDQYIESLQQAHVNINFSYGTFQDNVQVKVGLPHSIKKLDWKEVDLLVVDECHEFYLKPMVKAIVSNLKPKHQVLMTGSPSQFNKLQKDGKDYKISYISGSDLFEYDVFSPVEMDVVKVEFKNNSRQSITAMLQHAIQKNKNISKIMIAVKNIEEAKNVAYELIKNGRKVALSTSGNDKDSEMVQGFKKDVYDTLVVVCRGILGFSDNNITGVFDLRCSENVDISNQLFSRVLRKHPDNVEKFYYRFSHKDSKDFNKEVIMLHKIKAMMNKEIFTQYNGNNMVVRY